MGDEPSKPVEADPKALSDALVDGQLIGDAGFRAARWLSIVAGLGGTLALTATWGGPHLGVAARWLPSMAPSLAAGIVVLALTVFGAARWWTRGHPLILLGALAAVLAALAVGTPPPADGAIVGLALVLAVSRLDRGLVAERLAIAAAVAAYLGLLVTIYDIDVIARSADHALLSPDTVVPLLLLALAVACARPQRGMMAVFWAGTAGGHIARRLLPAALLLLPSLRGLRLVAQTHAGVSAEWSLALAAFANILILALLVIWSARLLHRADRERIAAQEALQRTNAELEDRVGARTRELTEANARLLTEVEVRGRTESLLRSILTSAPDAIVIVDVAGCIMYTNDMVSHWFGYTRHELRGQPVEVLIPERWRDAHARYRDAFVAEHRARPMGEGRQLFGRRKDGSEFPVEISLSPSEHNGALRVTAIVRDATGRRDMERTLRDQAADLLATNREMEAFSYSVSHDLRTPLRAIQGFSRLLTRNLSAALDAQNRDYLDRISRAALRMGELIDALLALARVVRVDLHVTDVDLSSLAATIATELGAREPERHVRFAIAPGLRMRADPRLMHVLLSNLMDNAWKFTAAVSDAVIEVGCTSSSPVEFFVRDNGAGFDMAYADKLFRPFQRLHDELQFSGTGIGLATVARVMQRHGGWVRASGSPGAGATFYFGLAGEPRDGDQDDTAGGR
ncbi:MAG: Adaptive-response sensory-kinase SasA [Rhodocyclaceae bacterium]|nr:Adaptive-response sensory-kinase SasA [Rhodocyclaceae bacterium]